MGNVDSQRTEVESSRLAGILTELRDDALDWCSDRSWMIRLPLFLYLAFAFFRHLTNPLYSSFLFGGITLGIHELGHVLFGWGPRFLTVAGGTIAQLAAPIIAGSMFLRQRDYFGISVAGFWLAFSLFGVATYMADARQYELTYVNIGGGELDAQDWDYMLSALGLLEMDTTFAWITRALAFLTGLISLAGGVWLLTLMMRRSSLRGGKPA